MHVCRRKHRKYTVEQPPAMPSGDHQLLGSATLQRQHPHIYGLLDIASPTTTLSPPEVTSSLDDVLATTTTTRTVAAMHRSCVCSCHEPEDFSTIDAGNERSAETYIEHRGFGETDCRHLHYHHLSPQPSAFRIHSSAARRASSSEGESMLEVRRPLWMSDSSADQRL